MSYYRFIDAQRAHYPVRQLCQVLAVAPSRYYAWRTAQAVAAEPLAAEPVLPAWAWSQSRSGECYDNAQAESLWSRLKTEELEARDWPVFADLAEAQQSVAAYFDYYNHERLHSAIAYQTPQQAHQQLPSTTALNCPV